MNAQGNQLQVEGASLAPIADSLLDRNKHGVEPVALGILWRIIEYFWHDFCAFMCSSLPANPGQRIGASLWRQFATKFMFVMYCNYCYACLPVSNVATSPCSDWCKCQVATASEKHIEDTSRHHEANQWSTKAIRKQETWRKRIKWSEKHIFWLTKDAKLVKWKSGHRTPWLLEVYLTTHRTCKNFENSCDNFEQFLSADDQNSPSISYAFSTG